MGVLDRGFYGFANEALGKDDDSIHGLLGQGGFQEEKLERRDQWQDGWVDGRGVGVGV